MRPYDQLWLENLTVSEKQSRFPSAAVVIIELHLEMEVAAAEAQIVYYHASDSCRKVT